MDEWCAESVAEWVCYWISMVIGKHYRYRGGEDEEESGSEVHLWLDDFTQHEFSKLSLLSIFMEGS